MKLTDKTPEEEHYMSEEERLKKFREQERDVSAQANLTKMNEEIEEEIGKSSSDESEGSDEEFAKLMTKVSYSYFFYCSQFMLSIFTVN